MVENNQRYNQARHITLLGGIKNILLALSKISVGWIGHSHALIADGVHSLADLLTDALVLMASRFGSKAADRDHPYGHGRIETAATMLLSFLLAFAGLSIIVDAGIKLFQHHSLIKPNIMVLAIALFSVFINEALFFYTRRVGLRINSKLLISNAWHHRSDSASSLVVFLGVGGTLLGFPLLDPIAAIIVGIMIIKIAWEFGWSSARELVDTALDELTVERIKQVIIAVPGVCELHQLRTRSVGNNIICDVHILVEPKISVSEGHFIGQQVHYNLIKKINGVMDVTVHVDPEDDEIYQPSYQLPPRSFLKKLLKKRWKDTGVVGYLDNIVLHYLAGNLTIDLYLPLALANQHKQLQQELKNNISDIKNITRINLYFSY